MAEGFTVNHVALRVRDAAASAKFYRDYAGMEVVHERDNGGHRVKWVQLRRQPDFMLVLVEQPDFRPEGATSVDHFGLHVGVRADVDAVARRAEQDGCLVMAPSYAGPIVGYFCEVRDPDGNVLEFACEQMTVEQQ